MDYLMSYIESLTRNLAASILHKELDRHPILDEQRRVTTAGMLLWQLDALVAKGRVNEAENQLFELLEQEPRPAYLQWGLAFYERLAGMDDQSLSALNFSHGEVERGLRDLGPYFSAL